MSKELTEQERIQWVQSQFRKGNEYLASKGILPDQVVVQESRYLAPLIAVWKMKSQDRQEYWVLTGDLPTDHMAVSVAPNAKEAIRAFSLNWQLKAQQILDSGSTDKTQKDFANLLISRAHGLYDLFDHDEIWQAQPEHPSA
ncbi:DUF4826 family protein [Alkalimonas collagenimarina]|uniref:DUF4826 family protein n=1 Tax=Alkalimonas collagenimarina TaxID=400390 RepID=A0ABT9H3D4_9GAMM|nr:DUF4826 family protein [Alkalimonas collagenimarina]MDP4537808.1 DUF4826 family protein [Alkalimonas collagenimarina]